MAAEQMMPFFTYFGGKWRVAPKYPQPVFPVIIEPFAGAAGYSVRNFSKKVILVEKDPTIAGIWRYLIGASKSEIESLPLVNAEETVDDLDICQPAKHLIGFWLNKGHSQPCKRPSAWMREGLRPKSFWGVEIRDRIANQVECISHWEVIEGDYSLSPDILATWFIDPPYFSAGAHYRCSSRDINFTKLSEWCKSRIGQVMVCENAGASWLPFSKFAAIKATEGKLRKSKSEEVIWGNFSMGRRPAAQSNSVQAKDYSGMKEAA